MGGFFSVGANEPEFPALTSRTSNYEFRDGTKVSVRAVGHVDKDERVEDLKLDNLEVRLDGKLISPKRMRAAGKEFLGVRLETIQVSRENWGMIPGEALWRYRLTFNYNSYAYDFRSPWVQEVWSEAAISFDKVRILSVEKEVQKR